MISFAGVRKPDWLRINSIGNSVLPEIEYKQIRIMGRPGAYDFGYNVLPRQMTLDVQLIGDTEFDIVNKERILADWLFHEDLQPIILDDEPNKRYMARFIGTSDVEELFRIGATTLTFIIPMPYAEGLTEKEYNYVITNEDPIPVTNNGSTDTFGVIDLTIKEDTTSIALVSGDKFVMIGQNEEADKTPVKPTTKVMYETFQTLEGWSSATAVDGGTIQGTWSNTEESWRQANGDFGTGSTWHGASSIKSLTREVQDFDIQVNIGLNTTSLKQVGRVEIYLCDINNSHIGKIALHDNSHTMNAPKFEARAGTRLGGKYFANTFGKRKGIYAGLNWGRLSIQRKGNKWEASISEIVNDKDSKYYGTMKNTWRTQWYDTKNIYTDKLAKIQIHVGAYGTREPVKTAFVSHITVKDIGKVLADTETPISLEVGDTVTIDNNNAIVLLNGEPCYQLLDPSSDFFAFPKGDTGLIVSPPVADMKIKFRERWL